MHSKIKRKISLFNDLIKNMIQPDENKRFSIENIKNHSYFSKEKFPEKFIKKEVMDKVKFTNILKSNFLVMISKLRNR